MATITAVTAHDVRFPTSLTIDGSDAMNKDGDYSAAYVVLRHRRPGARRATASPSPSGAATTSCVEAARQRGAAAGRPRRRRAVPRPRRGSTASWQPTRSCAGSGPEKGVVHLALAAVMNAVWDLAARRAGKPLWRLLADMTPEELVDAADLRYLSDALTPDEALDDARGSWSRPAPERIARARGRGGYPCYTTSAGWLGYDDDKLRRLLQEAVDAGYRHVKLKVGADLDDDIRRLRIAREVIGWDANLMIDANQVWDVPEAIEWVQPRSPSSSRCGSRSRPAPTTSSATPRSGGRWRPIGVATGEHGMNRVLFKQMFQAEAIDYCQLDSARLGERQRDPRGLPHGRRSSACRCARTPAASACANSCSTCRSSTSSRCRARLENRVTEYVDHLHEHFVDPCVVADGALRAAERARLQRARCSRSRSPTFTLPGRLVLGVPR